MKAKTRIKVLVKLMNRTPGSQGDQLREQVIAELKEYGKNNGTAEYTRLIKELGPI